MIKQINNKKFQERDKKIMGSLSKKAYELREKYKKIYDKYPRGWCHGEETMSEYEECLENLLNENTELQGDFKMTEKQIQDILNSDRYLEALKKLL